MTITRVQNTYLVSENVEAALGFYSGLGAALKFQDGDRWAQLDLIGTKLAIASQSEAHPLTQGTILVLETDDLDAEVENVIRLGGTMITRRDMGSHGTVALCRDPNENAFQLICFSKEKT